MLERRQVVFGLALFLATAPALSAGPAARTPILPPLPPWNGASRALVVPAGDPWITPSEAGGLKTTPTYDETIAWLRKLDAASPQVALVSIGKSGEGRDLWLAVVSADGAATPAALRKNGKPTLFAQGGIHAGEIDGKDAGMMLLRDLTVRGTRKALLDRANLLFLPMFNPDGHERSSRFGRINQRGPEVMGWRTTARNLNLNRDYTKLDAPEMRAMVQALNAWDPDLYVDLHVTDGADYQYDITWGYNGRHAHSPNASAWLETVLDPILTADLKAQGHIPGPLVGFLDDDDPEKGEIFWTAPPRFSHGYGDLRHLPSILVENHSLKPYDQRVLGTYVLLQGMLEGLGKGGLRTAIEADRKLRPAEVPFAWKAAADAPPETMDFLAIRYRREPSAVSGGQKVSWLGEPVTWKMPLVRPNVVDRSISRPAAYWIPPQWSEVIERLALHGIRMERLAAPMTLAVSEYRITEPKLATDVFEGHVLVTGKPVLEKHRETFPAGSVRIPTDQPLGDLAVLLLEPASEDSFFQWGFFPEILSRTEYVEGYIMEPMAEKMLAEDPALRAEYEAAVAADPVLAKSPQARLQWFYQRTPFLDERWRLYPVAREEGR
jgi:murein tripeptide amidase MpaA